MAATPRAGCDGPDERALAIAFAIQEWPTRGRPAGGAGIYVGKLARALAIRGHRVHVVTCAHADLPARSVEDGVVVHRLEEGAPNAKDPEALKRYSRAVSRRLRELDASERFDVVEFQEWAAEGWAFHPRRDQAMVVRLQAPSHFVRQFEYADHSSAERRVDELERWPVERADLVTTPSRLIARFAARSWCFDPEAATVIPNGVDAEGFTPGGAGPSGGPLVLCVNRLSPIKGPEVFVRAAAKVHAAHPAARFRMIGRIEVWDGELSESRLRRLAESLGLPRERLEIPGPADHAALPREYAAADVCVNPSLSESYSLTSAEALASGKACVLSDAMGVTEFLTSGEDCIIAAAGDADAFAEGIGRLLGDDGLRRGVGDRARATVETRLSTAATVIETEGAYRRVCAVVRARPPLEPVRLAVAMLTHNGLADTRRCLESLARHTRVPHDVFVNDNGSTDGTREWLSSIGDARVHVTLGDANLGVPGGRNRLLREILPHLAADGRIAFVDNDLEMLDGWHDAPMAFLDAHPEAGIAGEVGHPIVVHESRRELLASAEAGAAEVDVASGGFACFVRADCAREVGSFDEKLGLFWHEDDDYCVRAIMHGWGVFAMNTGRVVHHAHGSGVALPAVAAGGSPANQRYLAEKWRALGVIDDCGRVARPRSLATFELRRALARRLGRHDPIPQEELARAAQDLSALLGAPDVLAHVEHNNADLSPTLAALLDLNREQARAERRADLARALDEVREIVRECAVPALLRRNVEFPAPPAAPPRGPRRLSKLCDARDWDDAEWRSSTAAHYGEGQGRDWYARHRKSWEGGQVSFALAQALPSIADARGVVLHAGKEPVVFGLANQAREVIAADAYGERPDAPAAMLGDPGRFAPFPFDPARLRVVKANADHTAFEDDAFDFGVVCALHRCGSEDAAVRVLAECARIVSPGGAVVLVTEVGLNGVPAWGLFLPEALGRIMTRSGLLLLEEPDYSVDDSTLAGLVDLDRDAARRPHLVLARGDLLFTSGVFVLRRQAPAPAVLETRMGDASPAAFAPET